MEVRLPSMDISLTLMPMPTIEYSICSPFRPFSMRTPQILDAETRMSLGHLILTWAVGRNFVKKSNIARAIHLLRRNWLWTLRNRGYSNTEIMIFSSFAASQVFPACPLPEDWKPELMTVPSANLLSVINVLRNELVDGVSGRKM